jgi:hypothetical protein
LSDPKANAKQWAADVEAVLGKSADLLNKLLKYKTWDKAYEHQSKLNDKVVTICSITWGDLKRPKITWLPK